MSTSQQRSTQQPSQQPSSIPLEQVSVDNVQIAVNLLYAYLDRANKRGAFGLQESAKVMQCLAVIGSVARVFDAQSETEGENKTLPQADARATPNDDAQQGVRKIG